VADHARVRALREELRKQAGVLTLLRSGRFEFRTLAEAMDLGAFLARAFPDPERVLVGLSELLVNAVEHGNLELSYDDKGRLEEEGSWREEIQHRLEDSRFRERLAVAEIVRGHEGVAVTIRDQGQGFDPEPYLRVDPARLFDTHGRGILIAKTMSFDELEYRDHGREVVASVRTAG
jgi:anti-sigma regulatory factor (Ser/Thr protein kinase)